MKVFKIFIGSSIVEFKKERQVLKDIIYSLSDILLDSPFQTRICPFICETADAAMSKTRKQDEYNQVCKDSDCCIFLFDSKVGDKTIEELNIAYDAFISNGYGEPVIYSFIKNSKDSQNHPEAITLLKKKFEEKYKLFYYTYDNLDTIALRILLGIKYQDLESLPVEIKDGNLLVDGKTIEGFNIDNVMEFSNNRELNSQRDDEVRNKIFSLSMRMSRDIAKGNMSLNKVKAYRLLEMGDVESCIKILNE